MGTCCSKTPIVVMKIVPVEEESKTQSRVEPQRPQELTPGSKKGDGSAFKPTVSSQQFNCTVFKLDPQLFKGERKVNLSDKYEQLEMIGRGAFGEVRKIRDKESGKCSVMKSILKSHCQRSELFVDEIEILKQLDHPNIARFYEFYQDELYYYLVMEYCQGGDLFSLLGTFKSFQEKDVARILKQLLSALMYCHKRYIVHRDIKPENLVLEGSDIGSTLKVIDFGRSKILKPQTKLLELAGSVYYVAPEVVSNREYDEKCDIWSAGVILYLLLSGRPPFYGSSKEETMKLIARGEYEFVGPVWKQVSPDAKDLIKRMLAKDPDKRISARQARTHPWIVKACAKSEEAKKALSLSLKNLRTFNAHYRFQTAVLAFIASHLIDKDQEESLRKLFSVFDIDNDGQISKDELVEGYKATSISLEAAKREVDGIFRFVDMNKNGLIDYNEFLMANLKKKHVESEDNLKEAFKFFDQKQKGFIDIEDLRVIFGGICREGTLKGIIDDIDSNHDGKISFDEFKKMMGKYPISE